MHDSETHFESVHRFLSLLCKYTYFSKNKFKRLKQKPKIYVGHFRSPALLTRMSRRSKRLMKRWAKLSIESRLAKSSLSANTFGLRLTETMRPLARYALSRLRHARITVAPSMANSRAVSNPTPELPPVTMTIFPSSRFSCSHFGEITSGRFE